MASAPDSRPGAGPVPGPVDPSWFRRELFAGATIKKSGRTPRDEAGLFTSQMTFELAEGATVAGCVETVTKAVAEAVPTLAREEGKEGRVQLTGKTAEYSMIAICGEARGKMSAYVSYTWTTAPKL